MDVIKIVDQPIRTGLSVGHSPGDGSVRGHGDVGGGQLVPMGEGIPAVRNTGVKQTGVIKLCHISRNFSILA